MTRFRKTFLFTLGFTMISGFGLCIWQITNAQTKPLTYPEIITALNTRLPNASFRNKTQLIDWLIIQIRQRNVDKPLTEDREDDLRQSGATNQLIEVIRANSPSLSKPTPTPIITPVSTPTPTPTPIPTPIPTPTPTPKTDSGNITVGTVRKTTLPGGVEMSFAYVPAGSFEMGSTTSDDEKPIHTVKISQGFWMQTTEVTQVQWKAIMRALPSKCDYGSLSRNFLGDNKPIICVNWDDAQEFIRQMNLKNDGYKYRLPTEAEWEYAARSGTTGNYAGYLDAMAWYANNSGRTTIDADAIRKNDQSNYGKRLSENGNSTQNVATKQANAWGLYDMHGNVWEWCQDWYDAGYYAKSPASDPIGPTSGSVRVRRGGGWSATADYLRSADRISLAPSVRASYLSFRVVRQ